MPDSNRFAGILEFTESARTGSFTAAAAVLGITGSAVGKSISRLEDRLGTKLLHRTTRRLSLTQDGEAFLDTCQRVLDELEGTENGLTSGRGVPVGKLRLDLPGAFGRRHVLPTLLELGVQHARLDLTVMFSERTADIAAESIDLAVRIGILPDDSGLVARRLGTQRLLICAAPAYLARFGTPLSADELQQRDCIVGWRRSKKPAWLLRDSQGRSIVKEVHVRHELSDGEAMVQSALAGCGLCQLPTWLIDAELRSGALVSVLDEFAGAEMPIHAVWPQSKYMQPKLRAVIDALVKLAAGQGSGFNA